MWLTQHKGLDVKICLLGSPRVSLTESTEGRRIVRYYLNQPQALFRIW